MTGSSGSGKSSSKSGSSRRGEGNRRGEGSGRPIDQTAWDWREDRHGETRPTVDRNVRNLSTESSESEQPAGGNNAGAARPFRLYRLSRRKSLSENSLLPGRRSRDETKEVDAFGLPKITYRGRRSVSLMRDTFLNKHEVRSSPSSDSEDRKRNIDKETKTSNATEVKARFESGNVVNPGRGSRASSPHKLPQVNKEHLTRVKNKFKDIETENIKLPFPNYKPRPPRPKCKPPPPPKDM